MKPPIVALSPRKEPSPVSESLGSGFAPELALTGSAFINTTPLLLECFGSGFAPALALTGNAFIDANPLLLDTYWIFGEVVLHRLVGQPDRTTDYPGQEMLLDKTQPSDTLGIPAPNCQWAVKLGPTSGNLFGVRCPQEATLKAFLDANPAIHSLVCRTRKGFVVCLRGKDACPPKMRGAAMDILAEGDLLPLWQGKPDPQICGLVNSQPVQSVCFWELVWSDPEAAQWFRDPTASELPSAQPTVRDFFGSGFARDQAPTGNPILDRTPFFHDLEWVFGRVLLWVRPCGEDGTSAPEGEEVLLEKSCSLDALANGYSGQQVDVCFGEDSDNLVGILFAREETLNAFLGANPGLETFRCQTPEGHMLCLRSEGGCPPTRKFSALDILAETRCLTVWCAAPDRRLCQVVDEKPVRSVQFDKLVWPEPDVAQFVQELAEHEQRLRESFGGDFFPCATKIGHPLIDDSPLVRDIYGLFQRVVLNLRPLLADGTFAPVGEDVLLDPSQSLSAVGDGGYETQISICFGPASGNLFGIRFPNADALEAFRRVNPLVETLLCETPGGLVMCLRAQEGCPPAGKFAVVDILGQGDLLTVWQDGPKPELCRIIGPKPVQVVHLCQLVWPQRDIEQFFNELAPKNFFGSGFAPLKPLTGNAILDQIGFFRDIYWAFGNLTLLHLPPSADGGFESQGNQVVLEDAPSLKNLEEIGRPSKLAISFGRASGNLIGLCFTKREALRTFLDANPGLRTLQCQTPAGPLLCLRATDTCPPSEIFPGLAILAAGDFLVLWQGGPVPKLCRIIDRLPVQSVPFWELVWPDPDGRAWLLMLKLKVHHGQPVIPKPKGNGFKLNEAFWAHFLMMRYEVVYDPERKRFLRRDANQEEWEAQSEEEVLHMILGELEWVATFPEGVTARPFCDLPNATRILQTLRVVAARRLLLGEEVLCEFARQQLELCDAATVTVRELHQASLEFCRARGHQEYPLSVLQKRIRVVLKSVYPAISKSKSVRREGKCQNGFRGLRLKGSEQS